MKPTPPLLLVPLLGLVACSNGSNPSAVGPPSGGSGGPSVEEAAPQTPLTLSLLHGNPSEAEAHRALDQLGMDMAAIVADTHSARNNATPTQEEQQQWSAEAASAGADLVTSTKDIVADQKALVALGKALFWEQRAGSDGQTACATCHHSGGADGRAISTPGTPRQQGDNWLRGSAGVAVRSIEQDPASRPPRAPVGPETDVEPSGPRGSLTVEQVTRRPTQGSGASVDQQRLDEVPIGCTVNGDTNTRQVTCKNAPTVYGATLFDTLFHDGRATSPFRGYDHNERDNADTIGLFRHINGAAKKVILRIPYATAAAQATLPVLNPVEMSWHNRTRVDLARKLYDAPALKLQQVSPKDPVLAPLLSNGALPTYRALIQRAFKSEWTSAAPSGVKDYTVIETNFLIFWGLAIQAYEETLISDQSPFDRYLGGIVHHRAGPVPGFGEQELAGLFAFLEHGCMDCHALPETSTATHSHLRGPLTEFEGPDDLWSTDDPTTAPENTFRAWLDNPNKELDERVEEMNIPPRLGAPKVASKAIPRHVVTYNAGYYNVGAATECENSGQGEGFFAGQPWLGAMTKPVGFTPYADLADCKARNVRTDRPDLTTPADWEQDQTWIMGAYKTPMLRDLGLTGPYYSPKELITSGGMGAPASALGAGSRRDHIRLAVAAYKVFPGSQNPHLHPAIKEMLFSPLSEEDIDRITTFLMSLHDPRVDNHQGPFCAPSIALPKSLVTSADGTTPPGQLQKLPPRCTP
jgi:cytochrome c peroxidase